MDEIERAGVVAIIRTQEAERVRWVADALVAGGVRTLEITMTVPGAVEIIRRLTEDPPGPLLLGAGTVLGGEAARQVVDAGACFVVSPVHDPEVMAVCRGRDVAVLPGCFTPTEILAAWRAGADIVKVFPAGTVGTRFIRDVRAPLPEVKLMPTGGVTAENAGDWIRAGAVAVGVGSALADPTAIAEADYASLTVQARRLVEAVAEARSSGAR